MVVYLQSDIVAAATGTILLRVSMSLAIDQFQLVQPSAVPSQIRQEYKLGSFAEAVRHWHLDRLPRFNIPAGTYIVCPWCDKQKDPRSMQIDHIIPAKQYVRFTLYQQINLVGGGDDQSRANALVQVNAAYNNIANLLLCCMKCNTGEQKTMPSIQGLVNAAQRVPGTGLAGRLIALQATLHQITVLPTLKQGINVKDFVLNGPSFRVSPVRTRGTVNQPPPSPFVQQLSNIQNAVITKFGQNARPQFNISAAQLQQSQRTVNFANEEGRLCFYCLGLLKKQAFQLDHMHPMIGRNNTAANFNDPSNLIPICRTCNTTKSDHPTTRHLVDQMIVARKASGLPGIEHTTVAVPAAYADWETCGRFNQSRILGV